MLVFKDKAVDKSAIFAPFHYCCLLIPKGHSIPAQLLADILSLSQLKVGIPTFIFLSLSPVFSDLKAPLSSFSNAILSAALKLKMRLIPSFSRQLKAPLSIKTVLVIGLLLISCVFAKSCDISSFHF